MTRRAGGWPAEVTGAIGRAVRKHRDDRGWSGERLIRELADVGLTMTRSALTNLEAGRRESVGVHEVYALAAVLGIPPLTLLVPDPGADVAALPDLPLDGVRAVKWITGTHLDYQMAFVTDDDQSDPHERYDLAGEPLHMLRDHDALAEDVARIGTLSRATDRAAIGLRRQRIESLRDVRAMFDAWGWPLPPLPPELHPEDIDGTPDHPTSTTEETRP